MEFGIKQLSSTNTRLTQLNSTYNVATFRKHLSRIVTPQYNLGVSPYYYYCMLQDMMIVEAYTYAVSSLGTMTASLPNNDNKCCSISSSLIVELAVGTASSRAFASSSSSKKSSS